MATKTPTKTVTKTATKTTPKTAAKPVAKPAAKAAAKPVAKPVPKQAAQAAAPKAAKPASKPTALPKPPKPPKAKLVRDSFTMPQSDFALIAALKERALGFKRPTKKSELLRAGLQALAGLNDAALQGALNALAPLKPGRPKKAD